MQWALAHSGQGHGHYKPPYDPTCSPLVGSFIQLEVEAVTDQAKSRAEHSLGKKILVGAALAVSVFTTVTILFAVVGVGSFGG